MTESTVVSPSEETYQSRVVYLKDYTVPDYLVDAIDLCFELQETSTKVTSHLEIRRNPASVHAEHSGEKKTSDLVLDGENLHLLAIALDGEKVAETRYHLGPHSLILRDVPEKFTLDITTQINPEKNLELSGLYCSSNKFCTQCEAEGFRRITYFPDRPDVLARYTTTLIADAKRYPILLSNGNQESTGQLEDDRHWVKWRDPFKKPSYLFALVAGDFDLIEDEFVTQSGRTVKLRMYVEKGFADQTAHAIFSAKCAMRWDEINYGREYDLDSYMLVAIGDFNMGAMENKGLNIFNTKYILAKPSTATDEDYIHIASVIAHEYFHNWTGNRVTCRDWFQLSLKEGLTIFRDQSFTEDMLSRAVARIRDVSALREAQFPEDSGPLAHPVLPESYLQINNFYTSTIYNKGAEVLRMLQTLLGKPLFRKGMDLYFSRYDGQAVTIDDFVQVMGEVSGIELASFKRWYHQAGTPIVEVKDDYDPTQQLYTLTMSQTCPPTPGQAEKLPLDIPVRVGLLDMQGKEIPLLFTDENEPMNEKVLRLTHATQSFQFRKVSSRPVPSLLRHFSAPVKLRLPYTDEELQFLFKHDTDSFNRWEAGQKYAERIIQRLIKDVQQNNFLQVPDELAKMFSYVLQQPHQDEMLLAEMLELPTERYMGQQMEVIDVDAIHQVRELLLVAIAKTLRPLFLEIYRASYPINEAQPMRSGGEFVEGFNLAVVGKRQLKNCCLAYLMCLPDENIHKELGMQQFHDALSHNMTDAVAALVALSNLPTIDSPLRTEALQQYYTTWRHDALIVDKWFSIQAAAKLPNTLQQVRKLMHHEAFDIKNPNKVYALIGTFCHHNAVNFHAKNGEGYAFLRECVLQIDTFNPQIAARMVKPLTNFKRYDKDRQKLMREQLATILQGQRLSRDVYELVSKSLE